MIETQTEKPTVTITVPSWILVIGKLVDYAAKTASDKAKTVVEGIGSSGKSEKESAGGGESVGESDNEKRADGVAEEETPKNDLHPSKKFKFRISKPHFNFLKKLKLEKIKGIKAPVAKHPKIALALLVFVLAVVFVSFKIAKTNKQVSSIGSITSSTNSSARVDINRRFEVPIKNKDGSETGEKLGITITTIEKTNEILIKNSPAKTKNGKIFLVLNIEIQNDTKKQLTVKPVDMVRLIGDDGRSYAPDVHNNEVSAEPVSLRKTRVGYVVDGSKNNFKLLVGEVRGQQEPIEVSF